MELINVKVNIDSNPFFSQIYIPVFCISKTRTPK